MQIDRAGLRVLSRDECLRLLATAELGRIALSVRALPVILPVQFALHGERIVIATHHGTTLERATRDAVVAFEADGVTGDTESMWSVHVNGIASHVTDPAMIERLHRLQLSSWAPGQPTLFVAISSDHVTGRRMADATSPGSTDALLVGP